MEIITPEEADRDQWDDYVKHSPRSTFYHQWGWKRVVENSLKHQSVYLAAKEDGRFRGILPLFFIRTPWGKSFLASVPGANYGGICADSRRASNLLLEKAQKMTAAFGASYLELREFFPSIYDLPQNSDYLTLLIPLKSDVGAVWRRLRKSVRHTVKKAERHGLTIRFGPKDIPRFHDLYSRNMKRLGSPCFGPGFFEAIVSEFPDSSQIVWASLGRQTVAADLIVFFKGQIISLYAGTDESCLKLGTSSLLTWKEILYGCENGFSCYDFGRCTRGSGSFNFKKRWNGGKHPLSYYYYLEKGMKMPDKNPMSPHYRLAAEVWKRMPLAFTKHLGPQIVRYLH